VSAGLEVADLAVAYGAVTAVHGVSFTVAPGEIVALLGANGAGKSSTLKAVAGLLRPARGQILYGGRPIAGLTADRVVARGISLCPEGRQVFGVMTVEDNLLLGAYLRPQSAAARMQAAFDLFPVLRERRHALAGTLSGGEQQMLAMARALMAEPSLLLLDEPSLGLAPILAERVVETVRRIRDGGTAVLLVEQNAGLALDVADRGLVLETGRIALAGPADELARNPYVRSAYLGEDGDVGDAGGEAPAG
jgi:branched-chain amino acid transport system ATP-binding protein